MTNPTFASKGRIPERLGVQLYTLRDRMAEDVARTLAEVADIGYGEVEFAGFFGHDAGGIAAMLADAGLKAPSTHVPLGRLTDDLDGLLEEAGVLGHRWVVVPSVPAEFRSADGFRRMADLLNQAGERTRAQGIGVAFHNHDAEFQDLGGGETALGILLDRGEPGLVSFQLDLFWTVHAGEDPLAWFAAHPGRFVSVHAKDRTADGTMVAVGDGVMDFAALLEAGERAGVEHVFVEHDRPDDSLASVTRSYRALAALRNRGARG
jgi:sugar phosphate isomerase/epimerase